MANIPVVIEMELGEVPIDADTMKRVKFLEYIAWN